MTNEDWKQIEEKWAMPYSIIKLQCDGYELSVEPQMDKMKLYRMVYVNGWFKGQWLNGESEECRRFFRRKESFVFPKKYRDEMVKIYGKREYNKRKDKFESKITSYYPYWASFRSFKRHLTANNKEIKLVTS